MKFEIHDIAEIAGIDSEGVSSILEKGGFSGLTSLDKGHVRFVVESVAKPPPTQQIFGDPSSPSEALRGQLLAYEMGRVLTDSERARLLGLPAGCRIREGAKILALENFECGENVWIGEGAILDAQGNLEIGDNCQIGLSVMIWSHSSHKQAVAGKTGSLTKEGINYAPTKIGKNVFLAGPSVVTAGVTIGDGAIIAPLSFVNRDVPAGAVVSPDRDRRALEKRVRSLEKKIELLEVRQ